MIIDYQTIIIALFGCFDVFDVGIIGEFLICWVFFRGT